MGADRIVTIDIGYSSVIRTYLDNTHAYKRLTSDIFNRTGNLFLCECHHTYK